MRGYRIALQTLLLVGLLFSSHSALAGGTRCFVHGVITPIYENKEKTSLSDMLRLNFDADTRAKCEQMMSAYCQYNIKDKNYSPTRLTAYFKADMDKSETINYTFSEKCKIKADD